MNKIDPVVASFTAIASFDRRRREYKRVGWIYACRNSSFADPVFKVGQSARPPQVRISELSSSSAVYRDFQLVYFVHVSDRDRAEGQAQLALQGYRVNPNKEFFQAPPPEIVRAMDAAARSSDAAVGDPIQQELEADTRRLVFAGLDHNPVHIPTLASFSQNIPVFLSQVIPILPHHPYQSPLPPLTAPARC